MTASGLRRYQHFEEQREDAEPVVSGGGRKFSVRAVSESK